MKKQEMVQILEDELQDWAAIHMGVEDVGAGPAVVIRQGPDTIVVMAELWERFIKEASIIATNGISLLNWRES